MRAIDGARRVAALVAVAVLAGCGAGLAGAGDDDEYYRDSTDRRRARPAEATDAAAEPASEPGAEPAAQLPPVLVRRAPTSSGPLDGDRAGAVIFGGERELRACYGGLTSPAGAGVVYALLDVTAGGEVEGVLVGYSDVRDMRFLDCVEDALSRLAMPATSGPSVVQAYLVFGARDEAQARTMLRAYRAARAEDQGEGDEPQPMTAVREAVQGCAERVYRGRIETGGRLVLELGLEADGSVRSVAIGEDAFEGRLDDCVETAVEKLRLAVDEGAGTTISYPVIIQPTAAPAAAPAVEAAPAAAPATEG